MFFFYFAETEHNLPFEMLLGLPACNTALIFRSATTH